MAPYSIADADPRVIPDTAESMQEEAFRMFYERTAGSLRAYLRRGLFDPAMADDLLQESYLRLLKAKLPAAMGEEHLKNYLFRIATNLMHDQRARHPETALEETMQTGASGPADGDVTRLFAGLKPAQRQLLWLAYVERFSHLEIARMLSMKPQSIRPLLSRARHALAEALRRGGFGEVTR